MKNEVILYYLGHVVCRQCFV